MQQTRMAYSKKMCISLTNDDALLLLRYFVAVSLLFLAACSHLVHCSLIGFEYCVQANDISLGQTGNGYSRQLRTRYHLRKLFAGNTSYSRVSLPSLRSASNRGIHGKNRRRFALFFTGSERNNEKKKNAKRKTM